MTQEGRALDSDRAEQTLKMVLAGVLGQVGCLTLLVIALALVAGLWLDNQFHTRPLFVLLLMLGSVPLTLFLMFRLVLSLAPRLQMTVGKTSRPTSEEEPELEELRADKT
jgi:hypothetical protein